MDLSHLSAALPPVELWIGYLSSEFFTLAGRWLFDHDEIRNNR